MKRFTYPVTMTEDKESGELVVSFVDIPEALTSGDDFHDALEQAADCLEEAIAGRINDNEDIPQPSAISTHGGVGVAVPLATALKAAVYLAWKDTGWTKVYLANEIGVTEKVVRRLLDPHHGTKLEHIDAALRAMDKRLDLVLR